MVVSMLKKRSQYLARDNVHFSCVKVPKNLASPSSTLKTDAESSYERWYYL